MNGYRYIETLRLNLPHLVMKNQESIFPRISTKFPKFLKKIIFLTHAQVSNKDVNNKRFWHMSCQDWIINRNETKKFK